MGISDGFVGRTGNVAAVIEEVKKVIVFWEICSSICWHRAFFVGLVPTALYTALETNSAGCGEERGLAGLHSMIGRDTNDEEG